MAFSSLMRETFTERVAGNLGDARSTFSTLAARLGCDPSPEDLDRVMALRHDQHPRTLTPRAGVLDAISDLRTAGYAIGVLTDRTAETPELWPSLPYAAVVDAVAFSCEVGRGSRIPLVTTKSPGSSASRPRTDLRHFLDMPEDVPVPARRMAEHLALIVRAATAGQGGSPG